MPYRRLAVLAIITFVAQSHAAFGANTYYVAPTTTGTPNGSITNPFTSFTTAMNTAAAGDTIFVRGGTYNLTAPIAISKVGTAANPYHLFAYAGETPILDFSGEGSGQQGIQLKGSYWQLRGLTIQKARDNGILISGSNNVAELLTVRQNQDSGVQISTSNGSTPSNNLVLNTDSYFNYDPAAHGGNADGFAVKFRGLGAGNVINGARSWNNSDDGMDFWQAEHGVTVLNTWSFHNGFNLFGDTAFAGNGEGIKLGKDSGTHLIENMLTWGNNDNGVDINGNATEKDTSPVVPVSIPHGVQAFNITSAFNANRNYRYDENPTTTTPPSNHILRNNISYSGSVTINAGNTTDHNTFAGPGGSPAGLGATATDFLSTTDPFTNGSAANPMGSGAAVGPRQADGSLPSIDFLKLAIGSHLIDAGVDVGLPFNGTAPDVGWFESGTAGPALPGDYNGDGVVGAADYIVWRQSLNTFVTLPNDVTPGFVDDSDYTVWRSHFGAPSGGSGVSSDLANVPEPSAILSVALLAVLLATSRTALRLVPYAARRIDFPNIAS
jgi:hypothetical protein